MVTRADIKKILAGYDLDNLRIASLGGHSALDVCRGAKDEGFETVVVAQKDRAKTYSKYYKSRNGRGCIDHIILVDKFADVSKPAVQEQLRKLNVLFVQSRYFWVYCDFKQIENSFRVPIIGSRMLVRKEERDEPKNQYFILKAGKVPIPMQFKRPEDIDRLVIVKTNEASRGYERSFFLAHDQASYYQKAWQKIAEGEITEQALKESIIEEFIVGPQVNVNYFYSPLSGELEITGTDTRRQTNLDGLLRLTAPEQIAVLEHISPKYIENGHQTVTVKESLLEQMFEAGENFVKATKKYYSPGILGPFALQGAITAGPPKEEFRVFDVSMRIPGSPGTMFTPYTDYLYGENMSVGRRVAREVRLAVEQKKLQSILT